MRMNLREWEVGLRMRRGTWRLAAAVMAVVTLTACGSGAVPSLKEQEQAGHPAEEEEVSTLVYGSGDYTRINPAMDEHGEINLLLFDGLTARNGHNEVVPGLAKRWEFDEDSCTYTFYLEEGVQWHDGEPFTAEDVKFTIESIMNPDNGSDNAPNYEDGRDYGDG